MAISRSTETSRKLLKAPRAPETDPAEGRKAWAPRHSRQSISAFSSTSSCAQTASSAERTDAVRPAPGVKPIQPAGPLQEKSAFASPSQPDMRFVTGSDRFFELLQARWVSSGRLGFAAQRSAVDLCASPARRLLLTQHRIERAGSPPGCLTSAQPERCPGVPAGRPKRSQPVSGARLIPLRRSTSPQILAFLAQLILLFQPQ
jgi:hypothetical protein